MKKEVPLVIEENDWRLQSQEKYLKYLTWQWKPYRRPSPTWDHDHCCFCWATSSEYEGDLHEGYCTLDETYWICPECFADFKEMFHWTLGDSSKRETE